MKNTFTIYIYIYIFVFSRIYILDNQSIIYAIIVLSHYNIYFVIYSFISKYIYSKILNYLYSKYIIIFTILDRHVI